MITIFMASVLMFFQAGNGAPELAEGRMIEAGGEAIDIHVGHLVPCVADWNNDGKKDLLVGQFAGGMIMVYVNTGTDESPVFEGSRTLLAGGAPISLPAG